MNTITISGNLVADPEKFTANSGRVGCNFRLANNELVNGESRNNGFFDFTAWNQQALNILVSLKKGDRIIVTGRVDQQRWQREDGTGASRVVFQAQEVAASMLFAPVGVEHKAPKEEAALPDAPPPPVAPPAPATS